MLTCHWLICYDIAHPRRRARLARWLSGFGPRVQESVFEAILASSQLQRLLRRAATLIDQRQDRLSLYRISAQAGEPVIRLGLADVRCPGPDEPMIV